MYTSTRKDLPKNTVELTVTILKDTLDKENKTAFEKLKNNLQVAGFRKGKVPEEIAQKHISKETAYQEAIQSLMPRIYEEIVKKENLKPIVSPKIELVKAKENEDWIVRITVAQKPVINLGSYKEAVKKAKSEAKKADIWVPGKSDTKQEPTEKDKARIQQETLNKILSELLTATKVEIPDLILEEELNHRLTKLLDDIQKIGLTVDAYLKSKNTTMDILKDGFRREIEDTYKLEFLLNEIADKEGIKVEKEDLEKLFTSITDAKQKEEARKNAYFYATILRKQKTLDFLTAL